MDDHFKVEIVRLRRQGPLDTEVFLLKSILLFVRTFLLSYNINHSKQHATSKENARLLDIFCQSVEKHRGNVMKETVLPGGKNNLGFYLQDDCLCVRSHIAKLMRISYTNCLPLNSLRLIA